MSSNLCPNGHLWVARGDQKTENVGQPSLVCAVCGLVADFVSDDSATFQSPAKEGEPSAVIIPHDPTVHMAKGDDEGAIMNDEGRVIAPDSSSFIVQHSSFNQDYPVSTPANEEIVPGYEILRELGRGGMGVVYKARQMSLQRVVALKMILSGAHARTRDLDRFRSEAQAVARLHHPNIVEIYEFGEHNDLPYYSLEFVEGGSLARKIRGKPLRPLEAARITEELARAIQYCHQHGILHRDLKPSNILLTGDGVPKIGDFGLAKQLEADPGLTKSGMVMGTPSYMAPEQTQGRCRDVGPHTDIYALGAILYEMLAGRPPFKGDSVLETMEQVGSQEPPSPSRFQPKVPRDLETICLKAMAKEPNRRYRSALALAQDLERFQAGESILARREGTLARLWRKVRRRPFTAVAFLLVIALAAGGMVLLYQWAANKARINFLSQELAAGLEVQEWTDRHLQKMEDNLTEWQSLDPQGASLERQILHTRFTKSMRESFQQAENLPERDLVRIQRALKALAEHDHSLAAQLEREFQTRLREIGKELPKANAENQK
jgi:tRNA A-37 threonylcarbamoyl transferase component Bud32